MKIISHRGLWFHDNEKNTKSALVKSITHNYGFETDLRDFGGELVISHDVPNQSELPLDYLLSEIPNIDLPIAINIKSDGLAKMLRSKMQGINWTDWFVFDMSIPDMINHLEVGNPVFTRISDYEREPVLFEKSVGIWLDSFGSEWYDQTIINNLLSSNKMVCIVSPELHKRSKDNIWEMLKKIGNNDQLILCTDYPLEATKYFNI